MSTETIERPQVGDPALAEGDPIYAHIVRKNGLTDAYVFGQPVEALCGYVWVPSRDGKKYPLCTKCKEIADGRWKDEGGAGGIE